MKGCLKAFRYLLSFVFSILLIVTISVGAPLIAFSNTLTNRGNLKRVLENSGIYDNFLEITIEMAEQNASEQQNSSQATSEQTDSNEANLEDFIEIIKDKDSGLRNELEKILSPKQLKVKTERVIDGYYDWLEGKSSYPTFEISLFETDQEVKNFFTAAVKSKFEDLPTCPPNQQPPSEENPFELECKPTDLNLDEIDTFVEEEVPQTQIDELKDMTTFSSNSTQISQEDTERAQQVYSRIKRVPLIVLAAIVIFTFILLLAAPGIKLSFIAVGIVYLLSSAFIFFLSTINQITQRVTSLNQVPETDNEAALELIENFANPAYKEISGRILLYSIGTMSVGIVLIITAFLLKNNRRNEEKQL
jgi:hypothetical protein